MRDILRDALNDIAAFFSHIGWWWWGLAYKVSGIPYLDRLEPNFIDAGDWFAAASWLFIILRDSLLRIYDKAEEILDWDTLWSLIQPRLPDLSNIANWIANAFWYVTGLIGIWWETTQSDVKDWIDEAVQVIGDVWALVRGNVEALIAQAVQFIGDTIATIRAGLSNLEVAWSDFRTVVLPTLLSSLQVDDLIRSWFQSYEPFWSGWQDWRDQVVEFFTDPWEWLYNRFDDFIERFW